MTNLLKWWNEFVYGKSSVTVKTKRQFKPDRSMPEQPYDEIEDDRVAHDKVNEIFFYCADKYNNIPCNIHLIYHKTRLEILESEGGRDLLFRHNRYKRNLFKGTNLFYRPFLMHQTAEQMNEYLDALEKEKSSDIHPALDLSKQKFTKGQKVFAKYYAYCTGVVLSRTKRKETDYHPDSDGKVWWWEIRVHESLGNRIHHGVIEVPESCLQDLKSHVDAEKELIAKEKIYYKDKKESAKQTDAGLRLDEALRKAEIFLNSN